MQETQQLSQLAQCTKKKHPHTENWSEQLQEWNPGNFRSCSCRGSAAEIYKLQEQNSGCRRLWKQCIRKWNWAWSKGHFWRHSLGCYPSSKALGTSVCSSSKNGNHCTGLETSELHTTLQGGEPKQLKGFRTIQVYEIHLPQVLKGSWIPLQSMGFKQVIHAFSFPLHIRLQRVDFQI